MWDMTTDQVFDTLKKSWLYIDFGNQPGLDKLPREAAASGAVVLIKNAGAAKNYESCPLSYEYKFEEGDVNSGALKRVVLNLFDSRDDHANYKKAFKDQENYRQYALREKHVFNEQVEDLFGGERPNLLFFKKTGFDSELYLKYYPVPEGQNAWDHFCDQPSGISKDKREGQPNIIVSLTSWLPRIPEAYLAIDSILRQTVKPYEVNLYLSQEEFKDQELPLVYKKLQERGLTIKYVDEDLKSYNKLIHELKESGKDESKVIITFDDDFVYDPSTIEALVNGYKKEPKKISTLAAWKIKHDQNGFQHVEKFAQYETNTGQEEKTNDLLALGYSGVLYPPNAFNDTVYNKQAFNELAPTADDLWFFSMACLNKTGVNKVNLDKRHRYLPSNLGPKSLWTHNTLNGHEGDNRQFLDLVRRYDLFNLAFKNNFLVNAQSTQKKERNTDELLQFAPTFEDQVQELKGRTFKLDTTMLNLPKGSYAYNPSIILFNNQYLSTIRVSKKPEYAYGQTGGFCVTNKGLYASEIFLVTLDNEYKIQKFKKISYKTRSFSMEDARLFIYQGDLYVSYVCYLGAQYGSHMEFGKLDENLELSEKTKKLDIGDNLTAGKFEKNWCFFEDKEKLNLMYYPDPMTIYRFEEGLDKKPIAINHEEKMVEYKKFGDIRNSTAPIWLEKEKKFLFAFHGLQKGLPSIYSLGFALMDQNYDTESFTHNPVFVGPNAPANDLYPLNKCALPYGMILKNSDTVVMSFGVSDRECHIVELPFSSVLSRLTPVNKNTEISYSYNEPKNYSLHKACEKNWKKIHSLVKTSLHTEASEGIPEIAFIMMAKDEEDIITENLEWHYSLGFRNFYIIDHNSQDGTLAKLYAFQEKTKDIARVFITRDIHTKYEQAKRTNAAFRFIESYYPEVKWIFAVDADEFLCVHKPLKQILETIPQDSLSIIYPRVPYFPTMREHLEDETKSFYERLTTIFLNLPHNLIFKDYQLNPALEFCSATDGGNSKSALKAFNNLLYPGGNHVCPLLANSHKHLAGAELGIYIREFPFRTFSQIRRKAENIGKSKAEDNSGSISYDIFRTNQFELFFNNIVRNKQEGIESKLPLNKLPLDLQKHYTPHYNNKFFSDIANGSFRSGLVVLGLLSNFTTFVAC